jgi:hypothetical protein
MIASAWAQMAASELKRLATHIENQHLKKRCHLNYKTANTNMTWCSHISAFENEQLCRLSKMQKKMYYIDLLETIWPPPPTLKSKPTEHVEENVTTKHSPKP